MCAVEAIFFKLACVAVASAALSPELNRVLNRAQHLRLTWLRRTHVDERKYQHEKRNELDPTGHWESV